MAGKIIEQVKEQFNLNIYEARIYTAILSRGICAAGELADMSQVPRSRCYDVLEGLEKKGFVFQKIGRPIKYIAIPPGEVVDALKKQSRQDEAMMLSLIDEFKATPLLPELKELYEKGINHFDQYEISKQVMGKSNINLLLKEMFSSARKSIIIHTDEEGARRKNKILRKASKVPTQINTPARTILNKAKNVTLVLAEPKLRTVQVDEDQLLVFTTPTDTAEEEETAVWMKSPFATQMMKKFLQE